MTRLLAPAVTGVLRHADLPNRVGDRPALAPQNLNLAQLQHNLFGLVSFACHPLVLLTSGQFYPGGWTTSGGHSSNNSAVGMRLRGFKQRHDCIPDCGCDHKRRGHL